MKAIVVIVLALMLCVPAEAQLLQALGAAVQIRSLVPSGSKGAPAAKDIRFGDVVPLGPVSVALTGLHQEDTYTMKDGQTVTPTGGAVLYIADLTLHNQIVNGDQEVNVTDALIGSGTMYYRPLAVGDWKGIVSDPMIKAGSSTRVTVVFGVPPTFKPTTVTYTVSGKEVILKLN